MVRVFRVVRPIATVRFRVEPYPEPAREFEPVANTTCKYYTGKNALTRQVTDREAVSGMLIHSIFDVWQYEVIWTCTLTRLL